MKILVVAPEISTPHTEGRKRFVLDLLNELGKQDQTHLLTTVANGHQVNVESPHHGIDVRWRSGHLLAPLLQLDGLLQRIQPDVVLVFPYCTFRHVYGLVSGWFMQRVDLTCRRRNVPCITIMYALDAHASSTELRRKVSCLALTERPDWDGPVVNLGLRYDHWPELQHHPHSPPTLLFMAGMWEPEIQRVNHVLEERGLRSLFQAGRYLAPRGIRLIVSAPLFADGNCREYLLNHTDNKWPAGQLEVRGATQVPEIYADADLFVFPFPPGINQFAPTSVIEAMLAGLPVVISDLDIFDRVTGGGEFAFTFAANDPEALSNTVLTALDDVVSRAQKMESARYYARHTWSIESSCRQIRGLLKQLKITI